jgi:hypothetical protein
MTVVVVVVTVVVAARGVAVAGVAAVSPVTDETRPAAATARAVRPRRREVPAGVRAMVSSERLRYLEVGA